MKNPITARGSQSRKKVKERMEKLHLPSKCPPIEWFWLKIGFKKGMNEISNFLKVVIHHFFLLEMVQNFQKYKENFIFCFVIETFPL